MKDKWIERLPMLSVNPDAASRYDVARMAAELMQQTLRESRRPLQQLILAQQLYEAAMKGYRKAAHVRRRAKWAWEALEPAMQSGWFAAAGYSMRQTNKLSHDGLAERNNGTNRR